MMTRPILLSSGGVGVRRYLIFCDFNACIHQRRRYLYNIEKLEEIFSFVILSTGKSMSQMSHRMGRIIARDRGHYKKYELQSREVKVNESFAPYLLLLRDEKV